MEEEAQQASVADLAALAGLADRDFLSVYRRVCKALAGEFGATVFSGVGIGYADMGIEHGDVQYKLELTVHKSLKAAQ